MVSIQTGKLTILKITLTNSLANQKALEQALGQLSNGIESPYKGSIQSLLQQQNRLRKDLQKTITYFQAAQQQYENMENHLEGQASLLLKANFVPTNFLSASKKNITDSPKEPFGYVKKGTLKFSHRVHSTIKKDKNLLEYLKYGACIGGFAGFDIAKIQAGFDKKYIQGEVDAKVGTAYISGDAKALLFQGGKFKPALELEAEAGATLLQAHGALNIGNEYLSALGEATVGVGVASANAKAVIKKDEVTLKANVGVAAVKGEIKGSISIFGLKITATGSGELCSAGFGAEFSSKKGEFEFGTKVSLIAGLGFKIKVNY